MFRSGRRRFLLFGVVRFFGTIMARLPVIVIIPWRRRCCRRRTFVRFSLFVVAGVFTLKVITNPGLRFLQIGRHLKFVKILWLKTRLINFLVLKGSVVYLKARLHTRFPNAFSTLCCIYDELLWIVRPETHAETGCGNSALNSHLFLVARLGEFIHRILRTFFILGH